MWNSLNFKLRLIYLLISLSTYTAVLKIFNLHLDIFSYFVFAIAILCYYLTDVLNFYKSGFHKEDFIYPIVIDFLLFLIIFFHSKNYSIYVGLLIYMSIEMFLRFILIKLNKINTRVLLIGEENTRKKAMLILEKIHYKYVGFVGDAEGSLGSYSELENIIEKYNIEEVVLCNKKNSNELLDELIRLKFKGHLIVPLLTLIEKTKGKVDHRLIDEEWIVNSEGFNIYHSTAQKRMKRLLDLILSFILGILSLPIILITAVIVKLESPGPIFFRQKRVGIAEKEFEIIKFRSMKMHDPNEHSKYAGEKDNRITPFGKFMRKSRIDELPQLWNIFRGDMSFVGPRPEWNILCNEYREKIGKIYDIRHTVHPGVTGWAQVMYPYGVGVEDAREKLEYDLYYIKNQNFAFDIVIFFKTLKTVLLRKGI